MELNNLKPNHELADSFYRHQTDDKICGFYCLMVLNLISHWELFQTFKPADTAFYIAQGGLIIFGPANIFLTDQQKPQLTSIRNYQQ